MKIGIKAFFINALCVLLSISVYIYLCIIVTPKDINDSLGTLYYQGSGFLAEPENSLDVMIFGNSNVYSGFAPAVLFENYDITSYASGAAKQTLPNINLLLKKMLKTQKPKLVILETDCFFDKSDYQLSSFGFLTAPFVYHSRWREIRPRDFYTLPSKKTSVDINKGYINSNQVYTKPLNADYMVAADVQPTFLPEKNLDYINSFVMLCKKNGIRVLFCELPNVNSWNSSKHIAVKNLSQKIGVPFLDMNMRPVGFELNLNGDFRDEGMHLNSSGAKKTTEYIGRYIKENYNELFIAGKNPLSDEWKNTVENYYAELPK